MRPKCQTHLCTPVVMADTIAPRIIEVDRDRRLDETTYDEPGVGPKLIRIVIRKTYRGGLEGTGGAEVLTARTS